MAPSGRQDRAAWSDGIDYHLGVSSADFDFHKRFLQLRSVHKEEVWFSLHASTALLEFALIPLPFDLGVLFRLSSVSEFL